MGAGRPPACVFGDQGADRGRDRADVDLVVVATSGTAGLAPTIAALKLGRDVALANKEVLIMAGHLVTRIARKHGGTLIPVDSEHSAVWQCLIGEPRSRVAAVDPDGLRRRLPRPADRGAVPGHAGAGASPPELVDGTEDHRRLGHA